ncbi:periplasmic heavy metal sensor [Novispirillum sp. DQ9]|uniref:periplasmic heavy metal sensor n=1 Tax=Novispirillum sp. DQ9 TaxID=3398612 RepID=UPI003C7AE45E
MSRRASWFLVIALAVSLGVNLYAGLSLMLPLGVAEPADRPAQAETSLVERRATAMAEADAAVLRTVHAAHRDTLRAEERKVRAARIAVRKAVRAEPFDAAALDQRLTALRTALQEMQAAYHAMYVEAAPRLSDDGRRRMLARPPRAEPDGRGGGGTTPADP